MGSPSTSSTKMPPQMTMTLRMRIKETMRSSDRRSDSDSDGDHHHHHRHRHPIIEKPQITIIVVPLHSTSIDGRVCAQNEYALCVFVNMLFINSNSILFLAIHRRKK